MDIQNHWAEDNIIFAASRGLLSGTGNNQFSPDTGMTRGMFVTACDLCGQRADQRLGISLACKEATRQAINAHYGDNRLNTEAAVKEVLEQFGPERMQYILANTVLKKEHDGRISRDNKAWAKTIPMPGDGGDPRHSYVLVVDKVNPGLTDLFLKQARKVLQAPEKGSVLEKLKQEPPERKPAAPKKREPEQ